MGMRRFEKERKKSPRGRKRERERRGRERLTAVVCLTIKQLR